ncbi:MAG: signal transduction histidine kinase [Hyphomicrobiaceae bacterium]|jgi:signal transduction histidine kinase
MTQPATASSRDDTQPCSYFDNEDRPGMKSAGCVLVVDDDRLQQVAIAHALASSDPSYKVVCVGSACQAREALRHGDFSVALIDHYLGDGLGLELIQEAAPTPVVVVTGAGNEEIAIEAMRAGAYDYVVKDQRSGYLAALPATIGHVLARRSAEIAAETKTRELARANRELEEFAYVVSHDLKSPLRAVKGYIQLLREDGGDTLTKGNNEYLSRIDRSASQMDRLTAELLEYSRIGRVAALPEFVDTKLLVEDIIADTQAANNEIGAQILIDGVLLPVQASAVRARQLFQNLIGNALKFHGAKPPAVRVSARDLGGMIEFSIADNGIGIGPEHYESIFRVFSRVGRADEYEGTGIGLSVCKKICEQHGGTIRVGSVKGEGTTFTFTLPTVEIAPDDV